MGDTVTDKEPSVDKRSTRRRVKRRNPKNSPTAIREMFSFRVSARDLTCFKRSAHDSKMPVSTWARRELKKASKYE